jgi:hypothetical protein
MRGTWQEERMVVRMKHKMAAAFAVAIVVFVAVHFVSFPGSVPDFRRASGGGTLLDMTPEFSEDALYARLTGYGAAGRSNYAFRNVTVDVLLPLALLPFLFLWMRRALDRLSLGRASRALLLAVPILYVLFDLVENGAVLAMLANFPVRLHLLSAVLPYLTIIKRTASMLAILGPLTIFAFAVIRTQWARRHVAA